MIGELSGFALECPDPETLAAFYLCCLDAMDIADPGSTLIVSGDAAALTFSVEADDGSAAVGRLGDRVEALGGRLTTGPDGTAHLSGSLPLAR